MQFPLFAVYRGIPYAFSFGLRKVVHSFVRLLFLIGGHVHLCLLVFFCSFCFLFLGGYFSFVFPVHIRPLNLIAWPLVLCQPSSKFATIKIIQLCCTS